MPIEPHAARRCLRFESSRHGWTFADLLQTPEGDVDPEVFDVFYDTFCETVGADACTVTDPDTDGVIWFSALPRAA